MVKVKATVINHMLTFKCINGFRSYNLNRVVSFREHDTGVKVRFVGIDHEVLIPLSHTQFEGAIWVNGFKSSSFSDSFGRLEEHWTIGCCDDEIEYEIL